MVQRTYRRICQGAYATLPLLAALLLVACAAPRGPGETAALAVRVLEPPPGLARIFFYRTENPFLIALEPEVVVNGRAVGRSVHGQAFYRDAKPGRYEIFLAGDTDNVVRFSAAPGERIYVKTEIDFNLVGSHLTAVRVDESTGRPEFLERIVKTP
jgi:hypothetical protein